jgi:hypothetical protein
MEKKTASPRIGWILFALAVAVRLLPVIAAREMTIGLDDMFQYDMLARSLAAGEGFRWYGQADLELVERYIDLEFKAGDYDPRGVLTSFRAPGYPFFLSLIYRVFGLENRFFYGRLVQAFVVAGIAPLTYLLSWRVFPGKERTAQAAGMAVALYPYLIVYPLALATEVIFIPLVLGSVLTVLHAAETRRWPGYLLAGLLLGAAALTRSVILAILPFILAWLWWAAKDRRSVLIVLACVLAVTIPWSARNTCLHGKLTSIENSMGYNLYMGYHPETGGRFQYPQSLDLLPYLDDDEREQIGIERALDFIKADPGRVPELIVRKAGDFFGLERRVLTYFYANDFLGYIPRPGLIALFAVYLLPFAVMALSAAAGLFAIEWNRAQLLIGLVVFGYSAPHLILLAEPRFHLAIVPYLAILGAYVWTNWRAVWLVLTASGNRVWLAAAVVVAGLLLFNWGFGLWQDAEMLKDLFGPEGNQLYLSY